MIESNFAHMGILPINLDDLIHAKAVESVRREFKKGWSEPTLEQVIKTICAFANDLQNLNGGYIILGIEENDGMPMLPPAGLENFDIDEIQRAIRGNCHRIEPEYQPVMSPEIYQHKAILVIWVPGGELRPYQAPIAGRRGEKAYFVRQGPETREAKGEILTQLLALTATVPFDDRRNQALTSDVLSPLLVRNFLSDINSGLVAAGVQINDRDLFRNLRVSVQINGYDAPRNVGLLFFTHKPEQYFPGAYIEVVQFGDGSGGSLIEEKAFRGPLHDQVRQTLNYLANLNQTLVKKIPDQAEAQHQVAYPYEAMEEALVNAVYHRSYEQSTEPTKVYLYPDRLEIISYPGPVMGIELRHFEPGAVVPPVPSRNRRIGEFLKELRLAEMRGTGIPTIRRRMVENGSKEPIFEFDEGRTYFRVTLPAHPAYIVLHAQRESAHFWATGEAQRAVQNLEGALNSLPNSGALASQLFQYLIDLKYLAKLQKWSEQIKEGTVHFDTYRPLLILGNYWLDQKNVDEATSILSHMSNPRQAEEAIELALSYKRAGRLRQAHQVFSNAFNLFHTQPKAVHEYAQTKLKLAAQLDSQYSRRDPETAQRLTQEAIELLRGIIPLTIDRTRLAWCYYDLARAMARLKEPVSQIESAYRHAIDLLPSEKQFQQGYRDWRDRQNKNRHK